MDVVKTKFCTASRSCCSSSRPNPYFSRKNLISSALAVDKWLLSASYRWREFVLISDAEKTTIHFVVHRVILSYLNTTKTKHETWWSYKCGCIYSKKRHKIIINSLTFNRSRLESSLVVIDLRFMNPGKIERLISMSHFKNRNHCKIK